MGPTLRALAVLVLVGAFTLGVAWLFCVGLADLFPGGACGRVVALVEWMRTATTGLSGG